MTTVGCRKRLSRASRRKMHGACSEFARALVTSHAVFCVIPRQRIRSPAGLRSIRRSWNGRVTVKREVLRASPRSPITRRNRRAQTPVFLSRIAREQEMSGNHLLGIVGPIIPNMTMDSGKSTQIRKASNARIQVENSSGSGFSQHFLDDFFRFSLYIRVESNVSSIIRIMLLCIYI